MTSAYLTTEHQAAAETRAELAAARHLRAVLSNRVARHWFAAQRGEDITARLAEANNV